jgi:hypothetical protein
MQFSRARFLSLLSTMCHGASGMFVRSAYATDPMLFLVLREIHQRHRVQDEVHDVVLRHPVLHVRRKQEGLTP